MDQPHERLFPETLTSMCEIAGLPPPEEGKRKKSPIRREYAMQRHEVAAFIDRRIQSPLGHPRREQRGARQHQREFRHLLARHVARHIEVQKAKS